MGICMRIGILWGAICATSVVFGNSAVAAADAMPDIVGQPFYKAAGQISDAKMKAVVATVVGDRLPQAQCHVSGATMKSFLDSSGEGEKKPTVYVDLNCYKSQADDSNPGYSAGNLGTSAVASRSADEDAAQEWLQSSKGEAYCLKRYKDHPEWPPSSDDCAVYYPELVEKYYKPAE